VTHLAHIC